MSIYSLSAAALLGAALLTSACVEADDPTLAETDQPVVGASCPFGDGFILASGASKTIYPVWCPSDCYDFPNGGLDYTLFCLNGVLGEWDPALTGGNVGPAINGLIYNGYSRCTARPERTLGTERGSQDLRTPLSHEAPRPPGVALAVRPGPRRSQWRR
jgi:hypothetical protein